MNRCTLVLGLLALAGTLPALAQQQAPPPPPYTPTADERQQLDQKIQALTERLKSIKDSTPHKADAAVFLHIAEIADRLPVYSNKNQIPTVLRGLDVGLRRCEQLARGETPWLYQPGRSLRGYVSRVDGSIQPYGMVIPAGYDPKDGKKWRLDVVLHGRGPTEISFLQQMEPANAGKGPDQPFLELQPFGRGNNGWRWAGESDVFETLALARAQYSIDPDRTLLRGFSMGGHGAWQIGVHYPGEWSAVSPGAGFSDTRNYLKITTPVPAYQEQGWHYYDAVDYALNLFNTPFIAYGGDKDPQLQASLSMKEAATREGLPFNLIVGPNTAHAYQPDSLKEIMRQLDSHTRVAQPQQIKFVTWTLKYNHCKWVTVDALAEHYRKAVVDANAGGPTLTVKTENITGLTLDPVPSSAARLEIDGQSLPISGGALHLDRTGGKWSTRKNEGGLRKRHRLQGPIDDAFTDRFLVVRGTGTPWQAETGAYAADVLKRFQDEWRYGFRGEVPLKDDSAVTPSDWADTNLVLLGDPASNSVLARLVAKLPLRWTREGVEANGKHYAAGSVPVLVYPNPLNPKRYVVINSGHTWGMKDLLASNAYLFPKLPDWAVLKPGAPQPEVQAAGYFDEAWKFKKER